MSRVRTRLRRLLESDEGQQSLQAVWKDVTTKRTQRITSIDCPRCDGMRKVDVTAEVYPLRDLIAFMSLALTYGVGKPPEEKKVEIQIRQGLPVGEMSTAELEAIIEGEAEELEDEQPALPPASGS